MKRHYVLFGFMALCVLLATRQAQAKTQISLSDQGTVNKRVVFVNRDQFLRMAHSLGLTVRELKVTKDVLKRLPNATVKGCGCGALAEEGGNGLRCFKDCLQEAGVSYTTVIACGALCEATLVGCAVCVGVGEWIVMGCSLWCAWQPIITKDTHKTPLTPNQRRAETHAVNVASLSRKRSQQSPR